MKAIPLLVHRGELLQVHSRSMRDQAVLDDELPAALNRDVSGYILSRSTYVTEIKQETADDN